MSSVRNGISSEAARDRDEKRPSAAGAAHSKSPAELRQSERAVLYWWQKLAQYGDWPPLASLDLERMSSRDWEHRFLIRVHSPVERCAFLIYGQAVARLLGLPDDPVSQVPTVKQLPKRYLPVFVEGCNEVAAGRGPIRKTGAIDRPGDTVEVYRAAFLPVGLEPADASFVYGTFNTRILRKRPSADSA